MKNLLYIFLSIILITTSCSKDETIVDKMTPDEMGLSSNHFYGVKYPKDKITSLGIAQKSKVWEPCSVIKVKFLNGSAEYRKKVTTYAVEWEQYAGISFDFVTEGDADVRIGFNWNENRNISWSYTGTDCLYEVDQNEATMSFALWENTTEKDKKSDVLRAFGQVLGLELEHRHLSFDAGWTNLISKYWEGTIKDIPWDALKEYVFDPLQANNVIQTAEYDENSIMIWPFSRDYAVNTSRNINFELSAQDINFMQQLYPKDLCEKTVIATMKTAKQQVLITNFKIISDVVIDWGDGTREIVKSGDSLKIEHNFASQKDYTIKIYGDGDAIYSIRCEKNGLYYLDISNSIELVILYCGGNMLESLNVSNNTLLASLFCGNNKLTELDVRNLKNLNRLVIESNQISTIDLSNNNRLSNFLCSDNQITSIDLKNKGSLSYLICTKNKITSLDLSDCTNLTYFYCDQNQITSLDVSKNLKLVRLDCLINPISSLDVSKNTKLEKIRCGYTPLVQNDAALQTMIESLTNRSGSEAGLINLSISNPESWIINNLAAKNWIISSIF